MEKGSYLKWLYHCLVDVQCSLLSSLERKDYVQFIEASHVRNEYMKKIGDYEQEVLKEELEVAILEKKKQRIQVAINRNESLDLAKLEEELNQEREILLQQVNAQYDTQFETADLPSEALEELKELYKKIVEQFHPEVHNLTDNQKALFDKAVDCYRMRKLEELKIVYEMLKSTEDMQEFSLDLNLTLSIGDGTTDQQVLEYVNEIGTNYSLAMIVYDCFTKSEEELVLFNTANRYREKQKEVLKEIEALYASFPLNAQDMLKDEKKVNEYLEALAYRKQVAHHKMMALNSDIQVMLEELGL